MEQLELWNGDCLDLLKNIQDKSIDMILTDPPYGIVACGWDIPIDLNRLWPELMRVIKNDGAIVIFGNEPFSSGFRTSNLKMYRYDWKWVKTTPTGFIFSKQQPMRKYEDIMVFYNKVNYFPQNTKIAKDGTISNYPNNVLEFAKDNSRTFHPTAKPTALLEYLIKTYTREREREYWILQWVRGGVVSLRKIPTDNSLELN